MRIRGGGWCVGGYLCEACKRPRRSSCAAIPGGRSQPGPTSFTTTVAGSTGDLPVRTRFVHRRLTRRRGRADGRQGPVIRPAHGAALRPMNDCFNQDPATAPRRLHLTDYQVRHATSGPRVRRRWSALSFRCRGGPLTARPPARNFSRTWPLAPLVRFLAHSISRPALDRRLFPIAQA
ncbi:hypothetical protein PAPYR_12867 [Paratrimastix pyriformis]|uniref:Uncharacterized protein n=1 Tax=Paratrimastix pyriformis TaxID=342808 RepID=A0ABQ8U4X1_9EUKA|nr:hypothetical protein PAPYR_12867 [Paratrimastix pyriformis]